MGRFDAKAANPDTQLINWDSDNSNRVSVLKAFQSSGLDAREVVLLLGAVGEVNRVVTETLATNANAKKGTTTATNTSTTHFLI